MSDNVTPFETFEQAYRRADYRLATYVLHDDTLRDPCVAFVGETLAQAKAEGVEFIKVFDIDVPEREPKLIPTTFPGKVNRWLDKHDVPSGWESRVS